MIHLKNITKHFGDYTALTNISLKIDKGKIFGIIGASGAGKSTLLRCINLLEKPCEGEVYINNNNIMQFSDKQLRDCRKKISMIFQHFNLLTNETVYNNIALPLKIRGLTRKKINEIVTPILSYTNLKDKTDKYPAFLSGGEKQRVAIARALVNEPEVLLCDEATSALDPNTTKSILDLLKDINSRLGVTIILITHEMDVVKSICDEVAVIHDGKIVEKNTIDKIFLQAKDEITKKFIRSVTHEKITPDNLNELLINQNDTNSLFRLTFTSSKVTSPIITIAARKYDVDFNILHGDIETISNQSMGFLLVNISGTQEKKEKALNFLKSEDVNVEVIDDKR